MEKLLRLLLAVGSLLVACSLQAAVPVINIEDTVVKMPLAEGVGFEDAVDSDPGDVVNPLVPMDSR